MAESMVETCARAIYERAKTMPNGVDMVDWDRLLPNSGARRYWREYARAVLEAIKTPTEGMVRAAAPGCEEEAWLREWAAAIQAALNEGEGR